MRCVDRLTSRHGALLVVDVQEKLIARIPDRERLVDNIVRLTRAAGLLGIPVWATEQYPQGLGPTVPALADLIPHRPDKTSFHCCTIPELLEQLHGRGIRHVTLVGLEAHVCVAQTALELMKLGFETQIPADAVGSRHEFDRDVSLRRLERAGTVVSSAEAVIFEWTETADHPKFKEISRLIKEADRV